MRKIYGWQDGLQFALSKFPKPKDGEKPKPVNLYPDQASAVEEATTRGLSIEWQQQ
jgi:hypothetical protein